MQRQAVPLLADPHYWHGHGSPRGTGFRCDYRGGRDGIVDQVDATRMLCEQTILCATASPVDIRC